MYNKNSKNQGNKNFKKNDTTKKPVDEALEQQRKADFQYLSWACEALDRRLIDLTIARQGQVYFDKEKSRIGYDTIAEYLAEGGMTAPENSKISGLISILTDLARIQANPRLIDYHAAIRIMYFQERFQSYFSLAYDDKKCELLNKYQFLFNTRSIEYIGFLTSLMSGDKLNSSDIEQGDIYASGSLMKVKNIGKFEIPAYTATPENGEEEKVEPNDADAEENAAENKEAE